MKSTGMNLPKFIVAVMFVVAMICVYQGHFRQYQTVIKPPRPFKAAVPAKVSVGTKPKNKQHKPSSPQTPTTEKNEQQRTVMPLTTPSSRQPCDLSRDSNLFPPVFKTNDAFLVDYMVKQGYNATLGAGIRWERLDPLEEPLFKLAIADDPLCLPEELLSQVHVIDPRDRYTVGDRIRFRVDLYTGHGTRRRSGGDDVRMWLQSTVAKWSMVAAVTDLGNGSYLGDAVLKWSGLTLVKVSLTYSREYLRSLVELHHTVHSTRWIENTYRRGKKTEKAMCFPFAPVPGFDKWCNLTAANGDRTWFCAHPVSEGMTCSDRSDTSNLPWLDVGIAPMHRAVKPFAEKLAHCCDNEMLSLRLIPNDINITTEPNPAAPSLTLPPCWSLPAARSWQSSAHQGLIDSKGAWRPSHCSLPDLTRNFVTRCMQNTTLMLLGDSNQRIWFNNILDLLPGCTKDYLGKGGWHAPRVCTNKELNFTLMTAAHSLPFSSGSHADLVSVPLPQALDRILSSSSSSSFSSSSSPTSKTVLVLHYYRHLIFYSVQVYRQRVQEARRTLETWLPLHPEVTIFIRGAHAVYHAYARLIGDAGVKLYAQVWREEFAGLRDRVRFLDLWDLSVAARSLERHPEYPLGMEMIKVLLGYMCQGDTTV